MQPEFTPVALVEGIVLHDALAHHLRGVQSGTVPPESEIHELIGAAWFISEAGAPIRYGRLDREGCVGRLRRLYDHWRDVAPVEGDVIGVEVEIRAKIEGIDLPLVGFADLIVRRDDGVVIIDHKVNAARPSPDPVLDIFDLQRLALTRGYEIQKSEAVVEWSWQHLLKTKQPKVVNNASAVSGCDRVRDVRRLVATVQPAVEAMRDALDGKRPPAPTQAPFTMCRTCPFRAPCAAWSG